MEFTEEQRRWLDGEAGASIQWAMAFNAALGDFFDASHMVPVSSSHFGPDTRLMWLYILARDKSRFFDDRFG